MSKKHIEISSEITENSNLKTLDNKWDKYLVDYSNYTKEYIKHYKKSIEGNSISLMKYPYMKARLEVLFEKLFKAQKKNLLTKKQIKRMCQIQIKITNPA